MKTIISTSGTFALIICISLAGELVAEPATNILDLPTELLWRILERNNLKDLISFAKVHPHFRNVVDPLVRRIVSNQFVVLECPSYVIKNRTNSVYHVIDVLENESTTSDLFELFGHHITKLSVAYERKTTIEQHENLNRIISKHGAKWLKEISFDFGSIDYLYYSLLGLEGPFIQAEIVTFIDGISRSRLNFNKVFPIVRSLDLASMTFIAEDLAQNFPFLERLAVPYEWGSHRANLPFFQKTIESNPQLKHLTLPRCDWNELELLNKALPDLESLEISWLGFHQLENTTKPLRFNNMKVLKCIRCYGMTNSNQFQLEFGNIEEIEFIISSRFDPMMELLMQNPKLKKVTSNKLRIANLLQMINGLPNLEEYIMKHETYEEHIPVNEIVDFLRNAHQLKKVSFPEMNDYCNHVAPQVEDIWIKLDGPHFVRKTLD